MRRLLSCLVLLVCLAPGSAEAQSEKEAVVTVVKTLFDGMRNRDTALMRAQFAPGARMIGIDKKAATPTVQSIDPSQWIGAVGRGTGAAWDERIFDPVVEQDGDIAHVWTYYEFWRGPELSHCGYDSVFLVKLGASWKVSQIADTRRQDCKAR